MRRWRREEGDLLFAVALKGGEERHNNAQLCPSGVETALVATQPRDTTQLFPYIYIFKNQWKGNKKACAYIYAYIEKCVYVVSVVFRRGKRSSTQHLAGLSAGEMGRGIVTDDRCDNFLLFIKSKMIGGGMRKHVRIYAYI